MQESAHKVRNEDGRRASTDRRNEEVRSGNERRDEVNRRQNFIEEFKPDNRDNSERRIDQQRCEIRRKTIRRSERERRDK